MSDITIERIGNTGRAFRIWKDGSGFDIRTQSRRRYIVVSMSYHAIVRRSDNFVTATKQRAQNRPSVIIDTVTGQVF